MSSQAHAPERGEVRASPLLLEPVSPLPTHPDQEDLLCHHILSHPPGADSSWGPGIGIWVAVWMQLASTPTVPGSEHPCKHASDTQRNRPTGYLCKEPGI